ncbi:MAG TPA: hypothetical protein VEA18_02025, partial [Candidatus Kapabacteria bacterium]|nr:hypothetical protein [Candidatus Kapabacteria bacterium]
LAPSTLRDAVMMLEQCDPKNLGHAVGNAPARASETGEPVMPEIGSTKPTSRPTGFSLAA